jgi:nitroreductase
MTTIKILIMTTILASSVLESKAETNTEFLEMVSYAIKAPSGHNTQPWLFHISSDAIEIHPDFSRSLPIVDEDHRELYISLGCAAENLIIAAGALRYETQHSVVSDPGVDPFIRIDLQKGETDNSHLFDQIEKRQTNRSVYKGRTIAKDTLDVLNALVNDPSVKLHYYKHGTAGFVTLQEYVNVGNAIQMMDDDFRKELLSWIRFNVVQVKKNPDGLTYKVMKSPPLPGFLGKAIVGSFLKPNAQNKTDMEKIDSSSHLVLFTVPESTIENWIQLGRVLQRFLLETTRQGIACAFLNQPCEVNKLAEQLPEALDLDGEVPNILLRIGYADPMPYAPRRNIDDVVTFVY